MASTTESTNQPPANQLPEGNIRFVEYKKASLAVGDYEIVIDHEIKTKNKPALKITSGKKFAVRGERFQLDQSDIQSCFPPDKAEGDFSSCLPHLVLKNDMLPWERTAGSGTKSEPWLALLLFDEQEMAAIETKTVRLSELNRPAGWLESGESGEAQCRTLEVPIKILKNIIPSLEDLQWLCHIRQVGNERKEDTPDGYQTDYSVIIGNRLPRKGKKNTAHLVSLEGYYDTTRKSWYNPTDNKVQLICLKSWSFISTQKPYSFQEEAKKLNTGVLRSSRVVEEESLKNLLLNGYTLLRHQMRQGDKTVSLYRSPLAPSFIPLTIELPVTSADEVMRLYRETGLFDVSYAAAWQLGRLLALKDRDFSTVIYQWRRENIQKDIIKKEQEEAEKEMGTSALKAQITPGGDETFDLFSQVTKWLARLKILSGIPLHYLVSDMENMLPENSIRFFSVDANWIHSLVDGAVSVGRTTTADLHHDRITVKAVIEQADRAARQSRKKQAGSQEETDDLQSFKGFTGFLVRSEMIVNWPGLEIEAYSGTKTSSDKKLSLISMRRLDDNILICLFKGELKRIDIHPPAEGLHYGIYQTKEGIKIRNPQEGGYGGNPKYVSDLLFKDDLKSVLDVHDLAKKISKLFEMDEKSFTSAQFALAMISQSIRVSFLKTDS